MAWEVEFTDEFEEWWNGLEETEQIKIDAAVRLLEEYGPDLPYPMSSGVTGSRHSHTARSSSREAISRAVCVHPKRAAILLVGEDKTGDDRWYSVNVPNADQLYDRHLEELKEEPKKEESQSG